MQIFIICGYGIPANIETDRNYQTYLSIAFNAIYEKAKNKPAVIVPCGGPTNCTPPYTGTEAEVMALYISKLIVRKEIKRYANDWQIITENQSLSTLENLLFAKELLKTHKTTEEIIIFCEKTREKRLKSFAKHIFKQKNITVQAIDFDLSVNRYLDQELLHKKESLALKEGLWTLQKPERIKKHHELFEKKFAFLRRRQTEGLSHVEAVTEWFKNEQAIIQQLIPDHPILKK